MSYLFLTINMDMCEKYILYSNLCSNFGFVPRFYTNTSLDTIGQFVSGYVSRFDSNKYCSFFLVYV